MVETIKTSSGGKPFRVLMVTGIYPTQQRPHAGTFVKTQVDSLIKAGLEVEVLHPKIGQPALLRYASTTLQIWRKAFSRHYNVINGQYGLWCLICRLQWTTPVVAAYLGDDILGTIKTDGSYSLKGKLVAFVSRQLCYWVEAVIVKSEQMKRATRGPQNKLFVIPDGVNFEQFRPLERTSVRAELGWNQDRYYVLFANNPRIPVKNFALAQAAVEQVRAKGIDIELVVASGVSHETVVQYINACNALVLSSHAEGSPNVIREAMACNVPVVATDVGDVRDVISQTEGCTLCPPNNVEEMAAGIEVALAHTERTTGRQNTQHLSSDAIAKQIIFVYEQVTGIRLQQQPKDSSGKRSIKERAHAPE